MDRATMGQGYCALLAACDCIRSVLLCSQYATLVSIVQSPRGRRLCGRMGLDEDIHVPIIDLPDNSICRALILEPGVVSSSMGPLHCR